jgi:two-component system nitrate/nitrite response regulator NarL
MIRIAIVDDHQIVIDGLKLLLSHHDHFVIAAEATNGKEMLEMLNHTDVDVLMADVMMPEMDGYELSVCVRKQHPDIKILALSMNSEGMYIDKMIEHAGIKGYVLKTAGKDELIQAIETVAEGREYFTPDILQELNSFRKIKMENQLMNLTARELEIIGCMTRNLTNKQIADHLYISERTVETHRKNIFRKTNTHSVLSLLEFLKRQKIELSFD